jgi:hypothetical protein
MDTLTKSPEATQTHIVKLLSDLSPDSLAFVEQLVLFLRERTQLPVTLAAREKRAPYLYPTVPVPPSLVDGLVGIMPPVGGDALADTEALYDQV